MKFLVEPGGGCDKRIHVSKEHGSLVASPMRRISVRVCTTNGVPSPTRGEVFGKKTKTLLSKKVIVDN